MEPTATTGETSQAATLPIGSAPDLATYRKAKSEGLTEIPNAKAKPSTESVDEAPDQEVENDPELRAAIDELEAPKENESPAEKAARTRKHKEAARKGYQTRLANKVARLTRENDDLRRQSTRPSAGDGEHRRAPADRPAPAAETRVSDPNDPEPTLNSVIAKDPNDPDPYARLQRELAAWDRREEQRKADAAQSTERQRERAREVGKRLEQQTEHGRGVHRDYDAKIAALGELVHGHPADEVIAEALAEIDSAEVGGELLYRLASDLDGVKAAARSHLGLVRFIGRLERDITAAAAKPSPPAVSAAPAPHKPVAAASSASTSFDVTKPNGSVEDYRRHKAAAGARS